MILMPQHGGPPVTPSVDRRDHVTSISQPRLQDAAHLKPAQPHLVTTATRRSTPQASTTSSRNHGDQTRHPKEEAASSQERPGPCSRRCPHLVATAPRRTAPRNPAPPSGTPRPPAGLGRWTYGTQPCSGGPRGDRRFLPRRCRRHGGGDQRRRVDAEQSPTVIGDRGSGWSPSGMITGSAPAARRSRCTSPSRPAGR